MMTLKGVTVILIVLIWASDSLADRHHRLHHYHHRRLRRSTNEYILRKCIATVELIRKHRNEEAMGASSRKADQEFFQSQTQQERSPDFVPTILTHASQPELSKQSSVYRRMTHMRRRVNGHARRITDKQLADTPLKTVNINAPEDRPSAFKKKNPLPELAHHVSGRKIDSSPNVIIIKPVT